MLTHQRKDKAGGVRIPKQIEEAPNQAENEGLSNYAIAEAMTGVQSHRVDLGEAMHKRLESRFGVPMAGLKVFRDTGLDDVGAHGYAKGNEIHIADRDFNLHSESGQELLFHEAGHVVQQGSGLARGGGLLYDSGLEAQADSAFAAPGGFSMPTSAAGPVQGGLFGWLKKKLGIGKGKQQAQQPPMQQAVMEPEAQPQSYQVEDMPQQQSYQVEDVPQSYQVQDVPQPQTVDRRDPMQRFMNLPGQSGVSVNKTGSLRPLAQQRSFPAMKPLQNQAIQSDMPKLTGPKGGSSLDLDSMLADIESENLADIAQTNYGASSAMQRFMNLPGQSGVSINKTGSLKTQTPPQQQSKFPAMKPLQNQAIQSDMASLPKPKGGGSDDLDALLEELEKKK